MAGPPGTLYQHRTEIGRETSDQSTADVGHNVSANKGSFFLNNGTTALPTSLFFPAAKTSLPSFFPLEI
jgi:hypothetical protein